MDFLDVRDLPEEEARFIAALVKFLRERRGQAEGGRAAHEAGVSAPRQTFIHHLTVTGDIGRLRQCIADCDVRHPGVIRNYGPGHLGKTYMVNATADLSALFREAGIPCSVSYR